MITQEQRRAFTDALKTGKLDYIKKQIKSNPAWLEESLHDRAQGSQIIERLSIFHYAAKYGHLDVMDYLLRIKPNALNLKDDRDRTPIILAIVAGHTVLVDFLISFDADLTIPFNDSEHYCHGYLSIHWASQLGHFEIVKKLISKNPKLCHWLDSSNRTPVALAVEGNHLPLVDFLIGSGADLARRYSQNDFHLIHIAASLGHLEMLKKLLMYKYEFINLRDRYNRTPMLLSAEQGHVELVDYLAAMGANLTGSMHHPGGLFDGLNALHFAGGNGHHLVVKCLLKYGMSMDDRIGITHFHLIHFITMKYRFQVMQVLLDHDHNLLHLADDEHRTPLFLAAANDDGMLVALLLENGANPRVRANASHKRYHDYTPLHWACANGAVRAAKLLIASGIGVDECAGPLLMHAIHIASQGGSVEVVECLLDDNPDLLNRVNTLNQTPLIIAAEHGHHPLVSFLVTRGADLTIASQHPESQGRNYGPLYWAVVSDHFEVVQFLIDNYADLDIRYGADRFHLMHVAAVNGCLESTKMLLKHDPMVLNITDAWNRTPLFLASANGHAHVVDYLLNEQADLGVVAYHPHHSYHNKTALDMSIERAHHEVFALLVLKLALSHDLAGILSLITCGEQALHMMAENPALETILLQDKNVVGLIKNACSTTSESSHWYKSATKRKKSIFARINWPTPANAALFMPVCDLQRGGSGQVRELKQFAGQSIAGCSKVVKSLLRDHINPSELEVGEKQKALQREANFNQIAYPQDYIATFEINRNVKGQSVYNNRQVMDYVDGESACDVMQMMDTHQLAEVILSIAEELNRLHCQCKIIHGDVHSANIRVREENGRFITRFIDFGLSYHVGEDTTIRLTSEDQKWYAPELFNVNGAKVHLNQDVYSFGYFLTHALNLSGLYHEVVEAFPSVLAFMAAAKNADPTQRPTLTTFCEQLKYELSPTVVVKTKSRFWGTCCPTFASVAPKSSVSQLR